MIVSIRCKTIFIMTLALLLWAAAIILAVSSIQFVNLLAK